MIDKNIVSNLGRKNIFIKGLVPSKKLLIDCEQPVAIAGDVCMKGSIGAFSYVRSGRLSLGVKKIGRYCSIAPGVVAGDGNHPTDWLSSHPFQWGQSSTFKPITTKKDFQFIRPKLKSAAVNIGNDVWIGANAMIMPGVTIGDGSIIAAGSVVTRSVPPYAIVAGVPAKILRFRFDDSTIFQLLQLQWWRFSADSLLGVNFSNVKDAIVEIQTLENRGLLDEIMCKKIRLLGTDLLADA